MVSAFAALRWQATPTRQSRLRAVIASSSGAATVSPLRHISCGEGASVARRASSCSPRRIWRSSTDAVRAGSHASRLPRRISRAGAARARRDSTKPRRWLPEPRSTITSRGSHRFLFACARVRLECAIGRGRSRTSWRRGTGRIGRDPQSCLVPWRSQRRLRCIGSGGRRSESARSRGARASRCWGAPRTVGISLRALGLVEGGHAGERLLREAVEVLADRRPGSSTLGPSSTSGRCCGAATVAARRGSFSARGSTSRIGAARPPWWREGTRSLRRPVRIRARSCSAAWTR